MTFGCMQRKIKTKSRVKEKGLFSGKGYDDRNCLRAGSNSPHNFYQLDGNCCIEGYIFKINIHKLRY